MNIKQTRKAFESAGYVFEKSHRAWTWCPTHAAVKKDDDGNGIRVSFQFGEQQGRKGKPVVEAVAHCFPLFDGKRGLLNGAKARDFSAGREVSIIIGDGCKVRTNGCTSALFKAGQFIGKF